MWMRLRSKNHNHTLTASHSWDFHVVGTLKSAFWSLQVVVVCWMMFLQVQRRKSVCRASLLYCSGQCKRLSSCNKHFGLREAATGLPSHHKQTFRDRQESNSQASSSGSVHPWFHARTDVELHLGHLKNVAGGPTGPPFYRLNGVFCLWISSASFEAKHRRIQWHKFLFFSYLKLSWDKLEVTWDCMNTTDIHCTAPWASWWGCRQAMFRDSFIPLGWNTSPGRFSTPFALDCRSNTIWSHTQVQYLLVD